jgi:hypothetical protein
MSRAPHALAGGIAVLVGAAAIAVGSACSETSPAMIDDAGIAEETGAAGTGLGTGLPCDVQAVIENRCIRCHDGSGAPPALLDYGQLVAMSTKDPRKTRVVVAVELMKSNAMPPRPAVQPAPDEIASFEEWINAGTPRNPNACTDRPPNTAPAPPDAGTCTSNVMWTMGDQPSPLMHPGRACNACHQVSGGPNLRFAGTVFPAAHDVDDCNGKGPPPTITISVTDARDRVFTMTANQVGNFFYEQGMGQPPRAPFRVVLSDGTKTRAMSGSVTSGDCNSCHTVSGANGAPGRILAP